MKMKTLLFHSFGVGSISSTIFLQFLTLFSIVNTGRFVVIENNISILIFEIVMTLFALIYFLFLFVTNIKEKSRW
jgi:hypothetical protein